MDKDGIVGVDLAKRVFQLHGSRVTGHGSRADGTVVFRKKVTRGQVLTVLAGFPKCIVAMEACATAHFCAREIGMLISAEK